jgi:hypothetical protein
MNNSILSIKSVSELHDSLVSKNLCNLDLHKSNLDLMSLVELNHVCNQLLWHEEDLARRNNVEPLEIMKNKRTIDKYNQQRNDLVERIDEIILSSLSSVPLLGNVRQHSETAGSMIDRLSIIALKIYAVKLQTFRKDIDQAHISSCQIRLNNLNTQRNDLSICLDLLLKDCLQGKVFYKVYRQYKMYNDPKFNANIK